jgi:hypothetical protein
MREEARIRAGGQPRIPEVKRRRERRRVRRRWRRRDQSIRTRRQWRAQVSCR